MKLFYSALSPFVRKVMIVAIENGLDGRIETVPTGVNPAAPNKDLAQHNPLMKIPALITDDGMTLVESKVIAQYLDALGGNRLLPASLDLGKVAVASALDWMEFRNVVAGARDSRPKLFAWLDKANRDHASLASTKPK